MSNPQDRVTRIREALGPTPLPWSFECETPDRSRGNVRDAHGRIIIQEVPAGSAKSLVKVANQLAQR